MSTVTYPHISIDAQGVPWLTGTRTKVVEVVLDKLSAGWDADEIHRQHPHLSLSQIHCALAYYYDHQEEMDRTIEEDLREVERFRKELGESPIRAKLRAMGLIP